MKKFLILLLVLFCIGCSSNIVKQEETSDTKEDSTKFIDPISDDALFSYLNDETKTILKNANDGDVDNTVLNNLGKTIPEYSFQSYDGLNINLSDYKDKKVIFEVVSTTCSHCMQQAKLYNEQIVDSLNDIIFMQYFINGDSDSINSFYKEIGEEVPSNEIILFKNQEFTDYIVSNCNFEATPTFYFFNQGSLSFEFVGTINLEAFEKLYSVAFENAITLDNLVDNEGVSIFKYQRSVDDVKDDLGEDNIAKISELDNDGKTLELTLKNIGKTFDFYNQLDDESNYTSEVTFTNYINGDVMIVMINEYDEEILSMLNTFYNNNKDISLIVVNMSDSNNINMANYLYAPVASIMNQVPEILNSGKLGTYPSCVFIKDSIITGVYSNIDSLDNLLKAKNLFLTDESIAIVK